MASLGKIKAELTAVAHKSFKESSMARDLARSFPATFACVMNDVITDMAKHVYESQSEEEKNRG